MKTACLILFTFTLTLVSGGVCLPCVWPNINENEEIAKNFKNIKKVALVGSHAYKGYKLEMMRSKFGGWSDGIGWEFDTWNNWRENPA